MLVQKRTFYSIPYYGEEHFNTLGDALAAQQGFCEAEHLTDDDKRFLMGPGGDLVIHCQEYELWSTGAPEGADGFGTFTLQVLENGRRIVAVPPEAMKNNWQIDRYWSFLGGTPQPVERI